MQGADANVVDSEIIQYPSPIQRYFETYKPTGPQKNVCHFKIGPLNFLILARMTLSLTVENTKNWSQQIIKPIMKKVEFFIGLHSFVNRFHKLINKDSSVVECFEMAKNTHYRSFADNVKN